MVTIVRRTIKLHRVQKAFRQSNALYRGFVGGRGSGKTWVGAYDMIRRARRNHTYLVGSPTGVLLNDTTYPTFKAIAKEIGVWNPATIRLTPYPTVTLSTGATIRFRSAEDPEKMRGPNLSGVWLDEASMMEEEAFNITIACLREHGEQGWLSATFTPKGMQHWTYKVFGEKKPNTELFRARTKDNPWNPPGFQTRLEEQYSGLRRDQELAGLFVNIEGAEWPAEYFPDSIWFHEWPRELISTALALDPAQGKGERDKGCYAAFVLAGLDRHNVVWLECWASRDWDAKALAERMASLNRERRPNGCSTELNGGQGFLVPSLLAASAALNTSLPLYGWNNSVDKEVRIRGLGPLLAQSRIRVRDTPGGKLLVTQMRDFPMGEFVDCCDAAEMACRLLVHLTRKGAPSSQAPSLLR
jgi:phage terminase large subunit-like protein